MNLIDFTKEELVQIIRSVRRSRKKYRKMRDSTIVSRLLNNKIDMHALAEYCTIEKVLLELLQNNCHNSCYIPMKNRTKEISLSAARGRYKFYLDKCAPASQEDRDKISLHEIRIAYRTTPRRISGEVIRILSEEWKI